MSIAHHWHQRTVLGPQVTHCVPRNYLHIGSDISVIGMVHYGLFRFCHFSVFAPFEVICIYFFDVMNQGWADRLHLTLILTCPPRDSNPKLWITGPWCIPVRHQALLKPTTPDIAAQCCPWWAQRSWWQVCITPAQRPGFESRRELFDLLVMILPVHPYARVSSIDTYI